MNLVFQQQVEKIRSVLSEAPPGEVHQLKLAPPHRRSLMESMKDISDYRTAAVLALLVPGETEAELVLIERTSGGGVHSGQISFPGGKQEEGDKDFYSTAVREACEEIGIDENKLDYTGALSPLYIPPSKFMVYPFVAAINQKPDFILSEFEVQDVLCIPLSMLYADKVKAGNFVTTNGFTVNAPYYEIGSIKVWGATAMMISELIATLN